MQICHECGRVAETKFNCCAPLSVRSVPDDMIVLWDFDGEVRGYVPPSKKVGQRWRDMKAKWGAKKRRFISARHAH